jgi:hypothetical protein
MSGECTSTSTTLPRMVCVCALLSCAVKQHIKVSAKSMNMEEMLGVVFLFIMQELSVQITTKIKTCQRYSPKLFTSTKNGDLLKCQRGRHPQLALKRTDLC